MTFISILLNKFISNRYVVLLGYLWIRIKQLMIRKSIVLLITFSVEKIRFFLPLRSFPSSINLHSNLILLIFQSIIYRFIGYFSQQRSEQNPKILNNLSRLFILPPFTHHAQYEQLLISLSYSLIRSNHPTTFVYSSPARPLDVRTLVTFRAYWLDVLSKYLVDHPCSSSSFSLNNFTRQTSIHPRDILCSLYSAGFLVRHSRENSSVYLHNNAYHSMTRLNRQHRNQFLLLDSNLIDINDEKKTMMDKTK